LRLVARALEQERLTAAPATPLTARAALVHDWFQGFHGSERVVEAMRTGLFGPQAEPDVFTFHAALEVLPLELARAIVAQSRLGQLPHVRQVGHDPGRWRYLLPYMPFYFRGLDLDDYELVISSTHAFAHHVRPANAFHVCYCHTPIRYVWLPSTEEGRATGLQAVMLKTLRGWLRNLDLEASRRPDCFIANSVAVRDRVRQFYGRDAAVIHPPVDVERFAAPATEKEPGHFLWVHRLVSYKRPELVIEAFRELPYRLTMVGIGPLEPRLRHTLPPNVELAGWMPRDQLARLFARASGFIHIAEEDFGISMAEALAAGTPVLALNAGGARDIVRPDVDGVLIDEPDVASIRHGVTRIATETWDWDELRRRAQEFSHEQFVRRLVTHIRQVSDGRIG
jgi:glycosyltransferase involved in cell wall biosynthesis